MENRPFFGFATINWVLDWHNLLVYLEEHEEDFVNLTNDSYWRKLMNDKEIEMRRHPNRGPHWIPNRIRNIRENRWRKLLAIHGPVRTEEEGSKYWGQDQTCLRCGIEQPEWWKINEDEWNSRLGPGSSYLGIPWKDSYGWCPTCFDSVSGMVENYRNPSFLRKWIGHNLSR